MNRALVVATIATAITAAAPPAHAGFWDAVRSFFGGYQTQRHPSTYDVTGRPIPCSTCHNGGNATGPGVYTGPSPQRQQQLDSNAAKAGAR